MIIGTGACIPPIVCRKVMMRPLLESGLFLSLSLFFSTSRPSAMQGRATEGRAASSRERLRHHVHLSPLRPHGLCHATEAISEAEKDIQGRKDGEWRTPTMTATRQGARGNAGKSIPTVVPDVQHHYTAFFGDAGVRDLSPSLFLSFSSPCLARLT